MSVRLIILLVLALGSAGGTAFMAQNWLANERAQILASVPSMPILNDEKHTEILVAKTDLVPGSFLLKDKLVWQEWPEDALSDQMLRKGDVDKEHFVGSVIRSRIPAGQPLVPSAVVSSGEQGFLAAVLAPGMRAVTVPLGATSGVGGFVFPGDQVDLLHTVTVKPEGEMSVLKRKLTFTQTLLKNVRVLGKDQSAVQVEGAAKVAKSATLEVTPKQAEAVALAIQVGKLSLSLRSLADEELVMSDLFAPGAMPEMKYNISTGFGQPQTPISRLEIQDQLSLTTDTDVNFLAQKMMRADRGPLRKGSKVQVHRGGNSTVQEFK